MAKAGADLSDDVIKVIIVVGAGLALYSFIQVRVAASYGASKVDDTQNWFDTGWKKFWGSPEWAWRETLGQGGIRLTGNEPSSADERGFWKKDEGSWLWGWGPAKG